MAAIKNSAKEEIAFKALDLVESITTSCNEFSIDILRDCISGAQSDEMLNFIYSEHKKTYEITENYFYNKYLRDTTTEMQNFYECQRVMAIDEKMSTSKMCIIMAIEVVMALKFETNVKAKKILTQLKEFLNAYKKKPGTLFFDKSIW
jgi:hypothetical protein